MNWFYAESGQQLGPIPQEQFDQLVAQGRITDSTLVWHEGLEGWKPWSEVRPPSAPADANPLAAPPVAPEAGAAPSGGQVSCVECGQMFPEAETISFAGTRVCARCKPVFLQRLAEGAAPAIGGGNTATAEEILKRDYRVDVGRHFQRGLDLFKANAWLMILTGGLAFLIIIAASAIPILSAVLPIFIQGPIIGGLYLVYLRRLRNQPAEVGNVFDGFRRGYWQLVLVQFIQGLITMAIALPFILMVLVPVFMLGIAGRGGAAPAAPTVTMTVLIAVGGVAMFIAMLLITITWIFSVPLVADKGIEFWPAMELSRKMAWKRPLPVLGFVIVMGLLSFAGLLVCGIGLAVAGPIAMAAMSSLYDDLFGELAPQKR